MTDNENENMENNIIRGSYGYMVNYPNFIYSNYYINNTEELLEIYYEEKINLKNQEYNIKSINIKLLEKIHLFKKRCDLTNISHSNTINFILKYYSNLQQLIDKYIITYNKNLYKINLIEQKIYNIDLTIHTLKNDLTYV